MKKVNAKRETWIRIGMYALAALLMAVFMPRPDKIKFNYEENRPWSNPTLFAPFNIPIYRPDAEQILASDSIKNNFIPIFDMDDAALDKINVALRNGDHLSERDLNYAMDVFRRIYQNGVIDKKMADRLKNEEKTAIRVHNGEAFSTVNVPELLTPMMAYVRFDSIVSAAHPELSATIKSMKVSSAMTPNLRENDHENDQALKAALEPVSAAVGLLQEGEKIIDRGEIVSPRIYKIIKTYEYEVARRDSGLKTENRLMSLGQFMFCVLIATSLYFFLYYYYPRLFGDMRKQLCLLSLLVMFFVLAVMIAKPPISGLYAVPFTIVAIVTVVFYDSSIAIMLYLLEILACATFAPFPVEFVFIEMMAGLTAVYSIKQISKRMELIRTSGLIFVAYFVSFIAVSLVQIGSFKGLTWSLVGLLFINMIATSFAYMLIYVIEKLFGFTSIVTLVELSDISSPLLQKLSVEAPGTFQHSMAVSNLASAAAQQINANVQLVRAGALYHDIGKTCNPVYFTENQHNINPHTALNDPFKSARIIIDHVNNGIRLARSSNLPRAIQDIISQHHGKGLTKYFYNTYCNAHPGEVVDPKPFTYPGPNPTSKEASLIMMADVVEAASRSLKDHSEKSLSDLVNTMIDDQVRAGLHKDSPLSFSDITTIKKAFITSLQTMFHTRVVYPKLNNRPDAATHATSNPTPETNDEAK